MAALDDFRHLTIEEGQQQRTDVRAVDVRIGHDDDAVTRSLSGCTRRDRYTAAQRAVIRKSPLPERRAEM